MLVQQAGGLSSSSERMPHTCAMERTPRHYSNKVHVSLCSSVHMHTHKYMYSHVHMQRPTQIHVLTCIGPHTCKIYDHTATLRFRTLTEGLLRCLVGRGAYSLSSIPWGLNWKKKRKREGKRKKRKEGAESRAVRMAVERPGRVYQARAERSMWDRWLGPGAGSRSWRDTNRHGINKGKNYWSMWKGEEAEKTDPRIWGGRSPQ